MKPQQRLWWIQTQSDFDTFRQLKRLGVHPCHLLHYLQMASEKLSKAYLWRSGIAPPMRHTGLVRFLNALLLRKPKELERIAIALDFPKHKAVAQLRNWVRGILPLAYSLQNIAPAEAGNGPNPEYPWPPGQPILCPAEHTFPFWDELENTGKGRGFLKFLDRAIRNFGALC